MATLSFNKRNKTVKVLGDVKINGLLNSLGIEAADQWDGWTLMPTNSVINEPDKVVHFVEMPDFDTTVQMNDTSPDTLPEEFPTTTTDTPPEYKTFRTPEDGC